MCASCTTVIVYFDVNLHTGGAIAPSEYHNLKKPRSCFQNVCARLIQNTTVGALNMKQYQDLDQFQYSPPCFVYFPV